SGESAGPRRADVRPSPVARGEGASEQLARSRLQRLDTNLAELDHALAELQRQWSLSVHSTADACGLLAVEHDGKVAALGRDLHGCSTCHRPCHLHMRRIRAPISTGWTFADLAIATVVASGQAQTSNRSTIESGINRVRAVYIWRSPLLF